MSPPNSESAAFGISSAAREAAPTAVETRSEFRYRNRGACAAADPSRTTEAGHPHLASGAVAPRSRGAHPPPGAPARALAG